MNDNAAREKKVQEVQNAFGVLGETMLITYRSIIEAGATEKEAFEIMKAYVAGLTQGSKSQPNDGEAEE